MKRPPGPQGNVLLGVLRPFARNPLQFLLDTAKQYPDIAYFRLAYQHIYLLSHPDYIRDVLVTKASSFEKGAFDRAILAKFLGDGLVTSEGAFHKRQRRLMQPAFHSSRIHSYAQVMVSNTERMLTAWQDDQVRQIDDDMMRLTMYIVAKALFDADVSATAEIAGQAIHDLQGVSIREFQRGFAIPQWLPTADNRQRQQAVQQLDETIGRIVVERRANGVSDTGDLLSMLLLAQDEDGSHMSDQQVRDEVVTLFSAGHETTAATLTWAWYLLAQAPDVEAKLHDELGRVLGGCQPGLADLPQLPYTLMIIKETLRLYPPAWNLFARAALEEVEIGGYALPPGSRAFMSPYLMHRLPQYFPEPECFDPERWLPEREAALPKYAYIPFGAGARVCIGNSFAMMEAQLVLATIAQRFRLHLLPERPVSAVPLITLSPEPGLWMRLEKREVIEGETAVSLPIAA